QISQEEIDTGTSRFDLTVWMKSAADCLEVRIEYNVDLFREKTIERFVTHFRNVLREMPGNINKPISEIEILGETEKAEALLKWNDTGREFPSDLCLHELFERQAELCPEEIAVVCRNRRLSYRELNECANQVAHYLRGRGVGPEQIVSICLE